MITTKYGNIIIVRAKEACTIIFLHKLKDIDYIVDIYAIKIFLKMDVQRSQRDL